MATDDKLLSAIFKNDVASLPHRLQRILLQIHWQNIRILYKPEQQLLNADWLSRHIHETNKVKEIPDIYNMINTIESCTDIVNCMSEDKIRELTTQDEHLSAFAEFIFKS